MGQEEPFRIYEYFRQRFPDRIAQWRQRIDELRSECRHVVKGVMFLNLLRVAAGAGVDWVVDINPRKQGHFIPLMGQKIVSPDRLLQNPPDLVIVMNPEYEQEVRFIIEDLGIACEVVSIYHSLRE